MFPDIYFFLNTPATLKPTVRNSVFRNSFLFLTFASLLSSCATIINPPFQKINIDHDPGIEVKIDTSKYYIRNSETYNVFIPKDYVNKSFCFLRCNSSIPLIINQSDTLFLKPHRSYFAFWFANIYTSYGLGMLIDYQNDKSYEYPYYNYISRVNDQFRNIRFKPVPVKSIKLSLSVPALNFFHMQTDSGKINAVTGLGISAGIEYYLKNDLYLSLEAGSTMSLYFSRNDTVNKSDDYHYFRPGSDNSAQARYLSINVNKNKPLISYGIGLSLTNLRWRSNDNIKLTDSTSFYKPAAYKSLNLGLTAKLEYRLTPNFNLGLIYQPAFYDFKHNEYNYQHFITTKLNWRF